MNYELGKELKDVRFSLEVVYAIKWSLERWIGCHILGIHTLDTMVRTKETEYIMCGCRKVVRYLPKRK